jgi:hypothetical protein
MFGEDIYSQIIEIKINGHRTKNYMFVRQQFVAIIQALWLHRKWFYRKNILDSKFILVTHRYPSL